MADFQHSRTAPARRAFLSGLAGLPLLGGSIALLGRPTAAAVPITQELMFGYTNWLFMEHRMACHELAGHKLKLAQDLEHVTFPSGLPADTWHLQWSRLPGAQGPAGWITAPQPSTRAAVVLSAVGVDLTTGGARG